MKKPSLTGFKCRQETPLYVVHCRVNIYCNTMGIRRFARSANGPLQFENNIDFEYFVVVCFLQENSEVGGGGWRLTPRI